MRRPLHARVARIAAIAGIAGVLAGLLPPASGLAEPLPNLGRPVQAQELESLATTVYPDGRNLPAGRGTVSAGALLFEEQCAMCHGAKGIEGPAARLAGSDGFVSIADPLRPLRILENPILVMSVGAQWPHATSIFDYVRRAMPEHAPKSLTDDEVFAVTAFMLHLHGLLPATATVDRESLLRVEMPGRARGVSAWPEKKD